MILYEFEGKQLLAKSGITVPKSQLLEDQLQKVNISVPFVLKAQVLSGKRAQAGGVIVINKGDNFEDSVKLLFKKAVNNEQVNKILVEEKVEHASEWYLSLSYDTETRGLVLTISQSGGTGIEDREVKTYPISVLEQIATSTSSPRNDDLKTPIPSELVEKCIKCFLENDCTLLEINPLVETPNGWIALDAKIKLDDDAAKKHEEWQYPPRSVGGRAPTQNEIDAKKIDEGDYRGTAGSAYFDLPGDIAILSSGGGVSLTAMDALVKAGGKPANFTEYSGNPPKEKVEKLTKIVLNKENLHGLWIIGTVAANFTDIYETLSGIIEGLRNIEEELGKKFDFPIVIRRGGPRGEEAFEMLRGVKEFNLTLQGEETSITKSAQIMTELADKYKMSLRGIRQLADGNLPNWKIPRQASG